MGVCLICFAEGESSLSGEWPQSVEYHKNESTIRLFQNEKSYFTFHRACPLPWNPPSS